MLRSCWCTNVVYCFRKSDSFSAYQCEVDRSPIAEQLLCLAMRRQIAPKESGCVDRCVGDPELVSFYGVQCVGPCCSHSIRPGCLVWNSAGAARQRRMSHAPEGVVHQRGKGRGHGTGRHERFPHHKWHGRFDGEKDNVVSTPVVRRCDLTYFGAIKGGCTPCRLAVVCC